MAGPSLQGTMLPAMSRGMHVLLCPTGWMISKLPMSLGTALKKGSSGSSLLSAHWANLQPCTCAPVVLRLRHGTAARQAFELPAARSNSLEDGATKALGLCYLQLLPLVLCSQSDLQWWQGGCQRAYYVHLATD